MFRSSYFGSTFFGSYYFGPNDFVIDNMCLMILD